MQAPTAARTSVFTSTLISYQNHDFSVLFSHSPGLAFTVAFDISWCASLSSEEVVCLHSVDPDSGVADQETAVKSNDRKEALPHGF